MTEEIEGQVTMAMFFPLNGRIVNIRLPGANEGTEVIAHMDLYNQDGAKGYLSIPYNPRLAKLGERYTVHITVRPILISLEPEENPDNGNNTSLGVI